MTNISKYIVAVSGGVDSVVLLDMLVRGNLPFTICDLPSTNFIVAYFDHGIREDSAEDAVFVKLLAEKYGLQFETKREELGRNASEELARERRYTFLRDVAKKHGAKVLTAHHADDLVETIAINLIRGTGWRGLAVLDSPDIERPLLGMAKSEILDYAKKHRLEWREDSTNQDTKYLRNDVRKRLETLDKETRDWLLALREAQVLLKKEIDKESDKIIGTAPYARYMFINAPKDASLELLRAVFEKECGLSPTRPGLARALLAVKTFQAGKNYEAMRGVTLRFSTSHFTVDVLL